jgi:methylated-DNA-[protein]-cysteine S-methyltransferase
MTYWTTAPSPLGNLLLTSNGSCLTGLWTPRPSGTFDIEPDWIENSKEQPFCAATEQLTAYFAGKLKRFEIPLGPAGTPFQQRVWTELQRIPYGKTISYGELANRIGNSKASRAVGLANGSNPISIIIPCHRVIGSNGKLVGYGGGLDTKRRLLDFESRQLFW